MQVFGLEIRKANSIQLLYENVDKVLAENNINDIKRMAIAHSLQKMLDSQKYFDVCTIKHCVDVLQVPIDAERIKIYQTQHCIYWSEMLPEFRQMLIAMVLDDFREVLAPKQA